MQPPVFTDATAEVVIQKLESEAGALFTLEVRNHLKAHLKGIFARAYINAKGNIGHTGFEKMIRDHAHYRAERLKG